MCLICLDLAKNRMSLYDAQLMAGEMRKQIGEEHYQEIIRFIKEREAAKDIDWDVISDFEMDFDVPNSYNGNYGDTD